MFSRYLCYQRFRQAHFNLPMETKCQGNFVLSLETNSNSHRRFNTDFSVLRSTTHISFKAKLLHVYFSCNIIKSFKIICAASCRVGSKPSRFPERLNRDSNFVLVFILQLEFIHRLLDVSLCGSICGLDKDIIAT